METRGRCTLHSLLRLRLTDGQFIDELKGAALIREVHTYGKQVEVGAQGKSQHVGLGARLITEAEKIAMANGYKKIAVIAGIGAREYYKKFGYCIVGEYLVKELQLKKS